LPAQREHPHCRLPSTFRPFETAIRSIPVHIFYPSSHAGRNTPSA
jgi:hypothetical protein